MVDNCENEQTVREVEKTVQEKFSGTLLGGAVGDALGAPVEFMSAQDISNRHGKVKRMLGGGPFGWGVGEYTDDTTMMLCIAESLVEKKECDPKDIANRFVAWYKKEPKDIGNTTKRALSRLAGGCSIHEAGDRRAPTNGSVMRCAPIGLVFATDEEKLIQASLEVSAITHAYIDAKMSCVFISLMIAGLVNGKKRKDAYHEAVRKTRYLDRNFVKKYIDFSYKPNTNGLAVDTMLFATSSFMKAGSFREAVTNAVNLGGDTDTIGAVTGALAGAFFGVSAIPTKWSSHINPRPARHFIKLGEALFNMERL